MSGQPTGRRSAAPQAPKTRTPRRHRGLWALTVLLVLAGLVYLVEFSSVLGASTVQVSGNHLVSDTQIRQAAAIKHGAPLVRLDTGAIQNRIQALKPVRSVKVSVSYPSTVVITVTERQPVGYRVSGVRYQLVDANNVEFGTTSRLPAGLPELTTAPDANTEMAMTACAGDLPAKLAKQIASISAASPLTVTLTTADGRTVLWGGSDNGSEKARVVQALLAQPGRYFDVSSPDQVISRN